MNYRLSIIIPTKNRSEYCLWAVKSVLALNDPTVQIVVQDNGDTEGLGERLAELGSAHIKYNYHGGVLSFVDNFSEATSLADGEYLCMIGDDDGVLPNITDAVELMREKQLDCLNPALGSVYVWPSENPTVKNSEKGYLCLSYIKEGYGELYPQKSLAALMKKGGQDYQNVGLPRLYHGIVRKDSLEKIRSLTGTYFDGLTPDIYLAVALCFVCERVCKVNYPVTVSGICPRSGSADSATGRHTGELKDAPHFRGHDSYEWDEKAPAIYSVESIWGETALQALKKFGRTDAYDSFSVRYLDGICLWKYPQFAPVITEHAKKYGVSPASLKLTSLSIKFGKLSEKAFKKVFRKKSSVKKYYDVPCLDDAIRLTVEELKRKNAYT